MNIAKSIAGKKVRFYGLGYDGVLAETNKSRAFLFRYTLADKDNLSRWIPGEYSSL